jgi:hypothetical protein
MSHLLAGRREPGDSRAREDRNLFLHGGAVYRPGGAYQPSQPVAEPGATAPTRAQEHRRARVPTTQA